MFYCDLCSNMDIFWMLFLDFKPLKMAIFVPADPEKGLIHPLKALKEENGLNI